MVGGVSSWHKFTYPKLLAVCPPGTWKLDIRIDMWTHGRTEGRKGPRDRRTSEHTQTHTNKSSELRQPKTKTSCREVSFFSKSHTKSICTSKWISWKDPTILGFSEINKKNKNKTLKTPAMIWALCALLWFFLRFISPAFEWSQTRSRSYSFVWRLHRTK